MSTYERLKDIIVDRTGVDEALISPEALLVDDLRFDSLDLIEIVMAAEDAFGVMIDDEVLEKILTVHDAVSAIDAALSSPTPPQDRTQSEDAA
jgi:acyl carrier protein